MPNLRTFADLVDLADSGETAGLVETGWDSRPRTWRLVEVSNRPGTMVFSAGGTSRCYEPGQLRTDERLRRSIKRTAAMRRLPEAHGRVSVTFKHEDTQQGQPVGPVTVTDHEVYDRDPEVVKSREGGGIGIPFGYSPQGQTRLGWRTRRKAARVAEHYGVQLTEF